MILVMKAVATTSTRTRASSLLFLGRNVGQQSSSSSATVRSSFQLRWKSSSSSHRSSITTASSSSSKSCFMTATSKRMHYNHSSSTTAAAATTNVNGGGGVAAAATAAATTKSMVGGVARSGSAAAAASAAAVVGVATSCFYWKNHHLLLESFGKQQEQQQVVLACSSSSSSSTATVVTDNHDTENDQTDDLLLLQFDDDVVDSSSSSSSSSRKRMILVVQTWIQETLQLVWETVLVSIRTSEVALRLSPLLVLTPASMAADAVLQLVWMMHQHHDIDDTTTTTTTPQQQQQQQQQYKNVLADFAWWYTTYAMQALGPSFVKLCQWIATRRDIFPPVICDRLSRLHDDGIPHSWNYTVQQLKAAFGDEYEAAGLLIESPKDSILGCGSAAQVYFGILQEKDPITGEVLQEHNVAIKVLHPNFQRNVERDLWLMNTVAKLVHALPFEVIKMVNLPRACATFGSVLRRQADLRIEANNLRQFRANFLHNNNNNAQNRNKNNEYYDVVFPQPMEGWTTEQVLVEEYIGDAIPISQYLRDTTEQGSQVRSELAAPLLKAFLKMVFLDNFVHSDLHPGNVQVVTIEKQQEQAAALLRRNTASQRKQKQHQHKIVFLDAGIATSLCPNDEKNLKDLFRAVLLNDGDRAGRLMVERARYERCSQVEGGVDAFAAGIQGIVSEFHDRRKEGLTLGSVRIGALLSQVLDLCRIHGVEVNPSMATIIISTLILEGLGRSLEPNLNLIDASIPFVLGRSIRDSWRKGATATSSTTTAATNESYQ